MEKETLDMIKLKADKTKEETLYHMLAADEDYQNALKQLNLLEQLYDNLNLTESERCAIESYMNQWDIIHSEYSTYAYLAGLKDAAGQSELCDEIKEL